MRHTRHTVLIPEGMSYNVPEPPFDSAQDKQHSKKLGKNKKSGVKPPHSKN
jgi:hypothetical protein